MTTAFLAGLAGAMLFATGAYAADAIASQVDVTPATTHLSGDEWRAVSFSARRILKHVDQALNALADKQNSVATANIEKGLTLVKIVDGILPATIVTTKITGAGLTYQDQDPIKPTFVPIFREYDQVDIVSPVTAQKQQAVAVPVAKAANAKATAPAPKSASAPQYSYAGVDYTDMKLNLRLAKRDLALAHDMIKQGDIKTATLALQDIQAGGVIFEFSSVREPLVRAMDNLRLAESELRNKHPDRAKVALAGAVDALKNYEKWGGDGRSKEVAKLREEMDKVAKNIGAQNEEAFSKTVSGWWNKILSWFHI